MMGFDPRKWLSGLGPQQQPTVDQFSGAPYGQFGAPTMQDAMRFRQQQGRPKPTFNLGAYKAARDHGVGCDGRERAADGVTQGVGDDRHGDRRQE